MNVAKLYVEAVLRTHVANPAFPLAGIAAPAGSTLSAYGVFVKEIDV